LNSVIDQDQNETDLMSAFIQDELYHNSDKAIISECLAIMYSAMDPLSEATSNALYLILSNDEIKIKAYEEVDKAHLNPELGVFLESYNGT
jgi:cytochrome P450